MSKPALKTCTVCGARGSGMVNIKEPFRVFFATFKEDCIIEHPIGPVYSRGVICWRHRWRLMAGEQLPLALGGSDESLSSTGEV